MAKKFVPVILQVTRPLRKFLQNRHKYDLEAFLEMITSETYAFFIKKENIEPEKFFHLIEHYYLYDEFKLIKKIDKKLGMKMLFQKEDIKFRIKIKPYIKVASSEIGPFGFGNNCVEHKIQGLFVIIKIFD